MQVYAYFLYRKQNMIIKPKQILSHSKAFITFFYFTLKTNNGKVVRKLVLFPSFISYKSLKYNPHLKYIM